MKIPFLSIGYPEPLQNHSDHAERHSYQFYVHQQWAKIELRGNLLDLNAPATAHKIYHKLRIDAQVCPEREIWGFYEDEHILLRFHDPKKKLATATVSYTNVLDRECIDIAAGTGTVVKFMDTLPTDSWPVPETIQRIAAQVNQAAIARRGPMHVEGDSMPMIKVRYQHQDDGGRNRLKISCGNITARLHLPLRNRGTMLATFDNDYSESKLHHAEKVGNFLHRALVEEDVFLLIDTILRYGGSRNNAEVKRAGIATRKLKKRLDEIRMLGYKTEGLAPPPKTLFMGFLVAEPTSPCQITLYWGAAQVMLVGGGKGPTWLPPNPDHTEFEIKIDRLEVDTRIFGHTPWFELAMSWFSLASRDHRTPREHQRMRELEDSIRKLTAQRLEVMA